MKCFTDVFIKLEEHFPTNQRGVQEYCRPALDYIIRQ
jgi:hypothetical protein